MQRGEHGALRAKGRGLAGGREAAGNGRQKGDTYRNLPGHRQCPPAHHPVSRLAAAGATGKRMMLAQEGVGQTNKERGMKLARD